MATRITVAQLAEQVNTQIADLTTIVQQLAAGNTPLPQPAQAPADGESAATQLVEVEHDSASLTELQPVEEASPPVEDSVLELTRQAEKSKGGSLRFWSGSNPEGWQASVYISGADDYAEQAIAMQVTSVENGSAILRQVTTAGGSPKSTKGRHQWDGTFKYGGAVIQVFANMPKAKAKALPSEVGVTLAL